jgi:hypothetical protein
VPGMVLNYGLGSFQNDENALNRDADSISPARLDGVRK